MNNKAKSFADLIEQYVLTPPKGTEVITSQYEMFQKYIEERGGLTWNKRSNTILIDGTTYSGIDLNRRVIGDLAAKGVAVKDLHVKSWLNNSLEDNMFDPVVDLLKKCHDNWDGISRLQRFSDCFPSDMDNELLLAELRYFGVGAVARALVSETDETVKHDEMLVLVGGQGTYKTTALQLMGMGYTVEIPYLPSNSKELFENKGDGWILDICEMSGTKRDTNMLKAQLGLLVDRGRRAYGSSSFNIARSFIFAGTSNNRDLLKDPTGHRRFHLIDIGDRHIDVEWIEENMPQVWGELYEIYLKEGKLRFSMQKEAQEYAENFEEKDNDVMALDDALSECGDGGWISAIRLQQYTGKSGKVIAEIMKSLNFQGGRQTIGGKQRTVWWRSGETLNKDLPEFDLTALSNPISTSNGRTTILTQSLR